MLLLILILFFLSAVFSGLYGGIWVIVGNSNSLVLTILFLVLSGCFGAILWNKLTQEKSFHISLWDDEGEDDEND